MNLETEFTEASDEELSIAFNISEFAWMHWVTRISATSDLDLHMMESVQVLHVQIEVQVNP